MKNRVKLLYKLSSKCIISQILNVTNIKCNMAVTRLDLNKILQIP